MLTTTGTRTDAILNELGEMLAKREQQRLVVRHLMDLPESHNRQIWLSSVRRAQQVVETRIAHLSFSLVYGG